jgi:hypothetical protein
MRDVTSSIFVLLLSFSLSHWRLLCEFLSEFVGSRSSSQSIYVWVALSDFMHIYLCVCIHILMFLPVLQNAPVAGRNRNPPPVTALSLLAPINFFRSIP